MTSPSSTKIKVKGNTETFYNLLESCRLRDKNDNKKITHTSWGTIMGKYHIPDNKIELFHKLYGKEILAGKKLNIIETHNDVGPIIVDLDFKFDNDVDKRKYTVEHVKEIVKIYMDEIDDSFVINDKNNDIMAFVFERDQPYQYKGNTKDGIHIMFPFIISEPHIQYIIRDNVMKKCSEDKVFDDVEMKNQITDIVDRSVIHKNGWFMYGSTKPYCGKYKLTHIYDYCVEDIKPDEVDYRGITDMPKFFSIRRYDENECTLIKQSKFEEIEKITKKQTNIVLNRMKKIHNAQYDIKQISKLINILAVERSNNHDLWMEVGWCLYNINPNDIELLNLWKEFSNKYQKYKDGTSKRNCEREWSNMRGTNLGGKRLGIGSLYYWSKNDNYQEYTNIKREDIRYYIDKSMNCTNYDIARVLYEMYKYQYVCASVRSTAWYEFKEHRWREDDGGNGLRSKISTDLVQEYFRIISDYNVSWAKIDLDNDLTSEEKEKEKKKFEEKTKTLSNIMIKLKTTSFKDNIMKECKELFYERDFINKLDDNTYLIGFEDGIYDLKKGEFRDGEPEDYISMTTNNMFLAYDEDNEQVYDVMEFIRQVVPNYEVRQYVMKLMASMLQGYNAEEKFRIWTGSGGELSLPLSICKDIGKSALYWATLSNCGNILINQVTTYIYENIYNTQGNDLEKSNNTWSMQLITVV